MPLVPAKILILSDSKSALMALNNQSSSERADIMYEILYLIHQLIMRGSDISLLWVPGHSNLRGNEMADFCAKEAASNNSDSINHNIPISVSEACTILSTYIWNFRQKQFLENSKKKLWWDLSLPARKGTNPPGSISTRNLTHRLRTNAWLCRFLKPSPLCICGKTLDIPHFLLECPDTHLHFKPLHDMISAFNLPLVMSRSGQVIRSATGNL